MDRFITKASEKSVVYAVTHIHPSQVLVYAPATFSHTKGLDGAWEVAGADAWIAAEFLFGLDCLTFSLNKKSHPIVRLLWFFMGLISLYAMLCDLVFYYQRALLQYERYDNDVGIRTAHSANVLQQCITTHFCLGFLIAGTRRFVKAGCERIRAAFV